MSSKSDPIFYMSIRLVYLSICNVIEFFSQFSCLLSLSLSIISDLDTHHGGQRPIQGVLPARVRHGGQPSEVSHWGRGVGDTFLFFVSKVLFSCEEAALEVQSQVCPCVRVSDPKTEYYQG